MLDAALERLVDALCAQHPLGYRPTVEWRNLRVSAGIAYPSQRRIALSRILLTDEERMTRTLKHEYAHLLAYRRAGRRGCGHGPVWRQAMDDLGEPASVYHRYAAQRNQRRQQVQYMCASCGALILRARRLPARKRFLHAGCGGAIRFVALERLDAEAI